MRQSPCSLFGAVCILCVSGVANLSARQEAEGPPADAGAAAWLLVPIGGKAAALGQTAMADGGSSESVFWNPAGLAWLNSGEVGVHHARTFVSDNTAVTAAFVPGGAGVFALSAYLVDFGSQDVVPPIPGAPVTGRISPKNLVLFASYAQRFFGGLSIGGNYKLIQSRQDCSGDCGSLPTTVSSTHGFDLGIQIAPGPDPSFRIGAAIQHAGRGLQLENRSQPDPLPTRWQAGVMYRINLPKPAQDAQALDARLFADVENAWGQFTGLDVRVGLELGYGELIRLRTGYASVNHLFADDESNTGEAGPSVGIGVNLGRLSVDFSRVFFDNASFDEPVYIGIRADF